jgi:ribonuclease P protein component
VYLQVSTEEISGINILVSVSKRHFKRAVKRNRVKRQLREYYRLNNQKLKSILATNNQGLLLALIYTDGKLWSTEKLNKRLDSAFEKLLSVLSSKSEQS